MNGELRSRLERLRRSGELRGGSPAAVPVPGGNEFLFPGEEKVVETGAGPCYLRELSIPLASAHGRANLAEIRRCRGADLALPARDGALAAVEPDKSLFLDIETTGLSGGTGTWAFLIGLGWLEDDDFCLRQYFLRHPGEERAMLSHFAATADAFPGVVTFNGKIFDLPLLQTRQVLAGLPERTEPRYHIDLLPCSRRLWKERLSSCSLRSLEEALLGLRRCGDIPGEEIPAVYFDYLRRGRTARLKDVFRHNVLDILSMVTLLFRVARAAAGPEPEHPADCFALGRLHGAAGDAEKAARCYRLAARCGEPRLEQAAMLHLSFLYKRRGEWAEAAALWRELIERHPGNLIPYVELAKYYEHRVREYAAALELTERALARAAQRFSGPAAGELSPPALRHRLARLRRRMKGKHGVRF